MRLIYEAEPNRSPVSTSGSAFTASTVSTRSSGSSTAVETRSSSGAVRKAGLFGKSWLKVGAQRYSVLE